MPIQVPSPAPAEPQSNEPVVQPTEAPATKLAAGRRRTKKELIEAAEVPADGTEFEMKDGATGEKVTRSWPDAARLYLSGDKPGKVADFVDTADRYKALKWQEQQASEVQVDTSVASPTTLVVTSDLPKVSEIKREDARLYEDGSVFDFKHEDDAHAYFVMRDRESEGEYQIALDAWDALPVYLDPDKPTSEPQAPTASQVGFDVAGLNAEPGDEVRVGVDTLFVGHGGVLTNSPVADASGSAIKPHKRWQRELGAGPNGAWVATIIGQAGQTMAETVVDKLPSSPNVSVAAPEVELQPGEVKSETLPATLEQVDLNTWKVGTGFLEKIGLPDYSALQIGPITASRSVTITSGDMVQITRPDGSVIKAPREVIEAIIGCGHAVEIGSRVLRSEALTFIATAKPGSIDMARGGGNITA